MMYFLSPEEFKSEVTVGTEIFRVTSKGNTTLIIDA